MRPVGLIGRNAFASIFSLTTGANAHRLILQMKYNADMRVAITILKCLTTLLLFKVLVSILSNYPDYFPANFQSDFLLDRERYFHGPYQIAFYAHIIVTPLVLISGMILMSESIRNRFPSKHRLLGRIHIAAILFIVAPSSLWMAAYAYTGQLAGAGFMVLTILTAIAAVFGFRSAIARRFQSHRRWMTRCFLLLCSAVVLRLVAGLSIVTDADPVRSYQFAAWASWIVPLTLFELKERSGIFQRATQQTRA